MINYSNNTVTFYDGLIVLQLQGFNNMNNCACIYRTVCVPGFSEIMVPVRLPKHYKGIEAILEPLPNNLSQAFVGGCLTAVKSGIGMIRMLNFRPHPITLKRNALAASVIFPSSVSSISPFENSSEQQAKNTNSEKPSVEELEKFVAEYKMDICAKLTPEQRYELMNILFQNKDVFARSICDIKAYPNFELELKPKSWDIESYTRQY